jgi:flagellar biogenesis protein FliO
MLQRTAYHQPNPKHAITFAVVSILILMLPLFWSPLHDQGIGQAFPEVSPTASPQTVGQLLASPPVPATTAALQESPRSATPIAPVPPLALASSSPTVQVEEPPPARPTQDPTIDFSYHLRRVVLSLLFTIAMIALTLKLLQKHLPGLAGVAQATPGSFLNILAREAVGPTQSLALVRVGPKILLVGLCEQSMTTLCELSEAELQAMMPNEAAAAESADPPASKNLYGDVLRHYLSIVPGMGAKK